MSLFFLECLACLVSVYIYIYIDMYMFYACFGVCDAR